MKAKRPGRGGAAGPPPDIGRATLIAFAVLLILGSSALAAAPEGLLSTGLKLLPRDGASVRYATESSHLAAVAAGPSVTLSGGTTPYTEAQPSVKIDPGAIVTDPDDANLESGSVRISSGLQPGDRLVFRDQNGISGSYESSTGVLTLTGTAPVAYYRQALRRVNFKTTNPNPQASKTAEFTVNDGDVDSNQPTKQIAVTPVSGGPVVTTTPPITPYTEDTRSVKIDPGVVVTDTDDAEIDSATVRISSGFQSGDLLVFANQNGISDTYDADTGVLTLTGTASVELYRQALRRVNFKTRNPDPVGSKTAELKVDDGQTVSGPATKQIAVTGVNDAPVINTSESSLTYLQGSAPVAVDDGLTVVDPDDTNLEGATVRISAGFAPGDTLSFEDQAGIDGDYNAATGVLTLTNTALVAEYQTALRSIRFATTNTAPGPKTVEFKASDGDAEADAATRQIDVSDDADSDGVADGTDNCPNEANPGQENTTPPTDAEGDACDDSDGDGDLDDADNCRTIPNPGQENTAPPADSEGDACDDSDGDGTNDSSDNCRTVSNPGQENTAPPADAEGDACDDTDGDGDLDDADNCRTVSNPGQENTIGGPNDAGDACDDTDGDGDLDSADSCREVSNPNQENTDVNLEGGDTLGDACDPDDDADGDPDDADNCQTTPNAGQANTDQNLPGGDAQGDACDADDDADGVNDGPDNCDTTPNSNQADTNADGIGDACQEDADADGAPNANDNCSTTPNADQRNSDQGTPTADGQGDACDADDDGDGRADGDDNCPTTPNRGVYDADGDGVGHACDDEDLEPGPCANPVSGTDASETLTGTLAGDSLDGRGGDDLLNGLAGEDCLFGRNGDDRLYGGIGNDLLKGHAGADRLSGGDGDDRLVAGAGNDRILGGAGRNAYFGQSGDDVISARNGVVETVDCGSGSDRARADADDVVRGCEVLRR